MADELIQRSFEDGGNGEFTCKNDALPSVRYRLRKDVGEIGGPFVFKDADSPISKVANAEEGGRAQDGGDNFEGRFLVTV